MEYTLVEKLDVLWQASVKIGIEVVLPVAIGMVLITVVPGFLRGLFSPKPVPVRIRKDDRR